MAVVAWRECRRYATIGAARIKAEWRTNDDEIVGVDELVTLASDRARKSEPRVRAHTIYVDKNNNRSD
jgi:hypothetical protein